jgi:hypothetical protein
MERLIQLDVRPYPYVLPPQTCAENRQDACRSGRGRQATVVTVRSKFISWWLLPRLIFGRPEASFTDVMKDGTDCLLCNMSSGTVA